RKPKTKVKNKGTDTSEGNADAKKRITELRQELRDKEEYLQATNEELKTSNEELKSYNEEMQSINEELQSTNEELETSKEELQSTNEELATVNSELQTKVADLARANNDMNNLLAGTGIATVFVDQELRILRFTPFATKIINLIQSDVGRPVGHIVSNLVNYDHLVQDIQTVMDTLVLRENEVQTIDDQWYTMRILPYRTLDNVIEGAVLTFVNITESRKLQDDLHREKQRLQIALNASLIVLSNQDTELRYTWIHNAELLFSAKQIIGKTDADLFPEQEASQLAEIKMRVLENGQGTRENLPLTYQGKSMLLNITVEPLRNSAGTIVGITSASLTISGQEGTDTDVKKPSAGQK
ncbi:MAG: PAS domain-containing protein, partial [Desulfonatronovibrio sp.]